MLRILLFPSWLWMKWEEHLQPWYIPIYIHSKRLGNRMTAVCHRTLPSWYERAIRCSTLICRPSPECIRRSEAKVQLKAHGGPWCVLCQLWHWLQEAIIKVIWRKQFHCLLSIYTQVIIPHNYWHYWRDAELQKASGTTLLPFLWLYLIIIICYNFLHFSPDPRSRSLSSSDRVTILLRCPPVSACVWWVSL